MKKSTKGFYTVEAAIVLPVLILALLTIGYFIKVEGTWENVFHGALDETHRAALKGYDGVSTLDLGHKIRVRVLEENENLSELSVSEVAAVPAALMGPQGSRAYRLRAGIDLTMPLGFGHDFALDACVRYRPFIGKKSPGDGLGREGLENDPGAHPVVVFPQSGERYHKEHCTYVKATVEKKVLTGELKQRYGACGLCKSGELPVGSIVYCFPDEGSAYHKSSCRSINRQTVTMDREEAIEKGYTPCTKCGGG